VDRVRPVSTVELEVRDDGVGVVRLNRPDLNIYNLEMREDLIEAFRAVRDVPAVRAVVLAANGRNFSAGADLSEFGTAESVFEARRIRWWRDPWLALLDSPKPSVAALHGHALGAGFEMALMCDFRLAGPDTRLGLPETRLGMLPSAGGSQTLARLVGPGPALPVVLGGETFTAVDALRIGVVDAVVEEGPVDGAALAMAGRLAALDPARAGAAKRALRAAGDLPLPAGLEHERHLLRSVSGP
jgi:enoyl-CoA hydratase/carnithine racemase